jgi:hypothetical protein
MAEANLQDAASNAYAHLGNTWKNGDLKTKLTAFYVAINGTFEEQTPNDHPIGNWIALIAGVAGECPSAFTDIADQYAQFPYLNAAAQYVYRLCWLADYLEDQLFISSAQAAAVLAAYNAQFT